MLRDPWGPVPPSAASLVSVCCRADGALYLYDVSRIHPLSQKSLRRMRNSGKNKTTKSQKFLLAFIYTLCQNLIFWSVLSNLTNTIKLTQINVKF